MYTTVTPRQICVSSIETSIRSMNKKKVAEFYFTALTTFGREYFFRYQINETGKPAWYMYAPGEGFDHPATLSMPREGALGELSVDYTLQELDELCSRIEELPVLTSFLIIGGNPEYADLIFLPLNKNIISYFKAFNSVSTEFIDKGILTAAECLLPDSRIIVFTSEQQKEYESQPTTDLGIIQRKMETQGFFIYNSNDIPGFIVDTINNAKSKAQEFSLRRITGSLDGQVLDIEGRHVGVMRGIDKIFADYTFEAQRQQRIDAGMHAPKDEYLSKANASENQEKLRKFLEEDKHAATPAASANPE